MQRITERVTDAPDQLAADEALLLEADEAGGQEMLRVWEFAEPAVVVGRASRVEVEIDRSYCESQGIAILRRCRRIGDDPLQYDSTIPYHFGLALSVFSSNSSLVRK